MRERKRDGVKRVNLKSIPSLTSRASPFLDFVSKVLLL